MSKTFFWMHIKKCGGQSVRQILQPHYSTVSRGKKPPCFIQAKKEYWNDIVNNYRTPLGEYQFKRGIFSKKYLFEEEWNEMYKFSIIRHPHDRCVSMFHSLFVGNNELSRLDILEESIRKKKNFYSHKYRFSLFMEYVQRSLRSEIPYKPLSLHFNTHINPYSRDLTNDDGDLIFDVLYDIEDLYDAMRHVKCVCGLGKNIDKVHNNKTKGIKYEPTQKQRRKIRLLYEKDFTLYDSVYELN